jgi:hypothetical protein
MRGGNEEGVGRVDHAQRLGGQGGGHAAARRRRRPLVERFARPDVLRAVAEALGHGDVQARPADGSDAAVGAVAPAGVGLQPQQADGGTNPKVAARVGIPQGFGPQAQQLRRRRMRETHGSRHQRGPGLPPVVERARHQEWQLGEEGAVLLGHEVAQQPRPDLRHARADTGALLQQALARVPGALCRIVHDGSPTGELAKGTKPGKASTRCSHARSAGNSCSDTLPSGARAT